jgi:DNA-binding winged helix-turn-helix (wHTH) protein
MLSSVAHAPRWDRDEVIRAGALEIRPRQGLALANGQALTLSVREFGLLVALARREGDIVRREDLYGAVWGARLRAGDRSVDVYIHKLRAKLERAQPGWRFIHTHVGFGYRFAPERSHLVDLPATSDQRTRDTTHTGQEEHHRETPQPSSRPCRRRAGAGRRRVR